MAPGKGHESRWLNSRLVDWAPLVAVLVGFGLVRLGVLGWGLRRSGLPTSGLAWSGFVAGLAGAAQTVAVAALLPAARRRRPVLGWTVAASGISTAVLAASLWVSVGASSDPVGPAGQVGLSVMFGVSAMVLCRTGFGWVRRGPQGYALPLIGRAAGFVTAGVVVTGAASGAAAWTISQPMVIDRLLHLLALVCLFCAVGVGTVWLLAVGEQHRRYREAVIDDMYRRMNEGHE